MIHDILVIGNGFDLAHDLDTKYSDFIHYIRNEFYKNDTYLSKEETSELEQISNKNGFIKYLLDLTNHIPRWVDFESELYRIANELSYFFQNYSTMLFKSPATVINPTSISEFLLDILIDLYIVKPVDKQYFMEPKFFNKKYGLNKKELLSSITRQLDALIHGLELYLLRCQRKFDNELITQEKRISQITDIFPSYVISFNYTDTYKIYGIKEENVFHVHGKLENNNMVLGFDDNNPNDLNFIYFKKYFQRIQKLTGYIDESRFQFLEQNNKRIPMATIHFYGHSMDKTDEDIIRELKSLARGFIIYTHGNSDYAQKVINLIEIFGKDEATAMIQKKFIEFKDCQRN